MTDWLAYCAPGREVLASIALALQGEDVSEVKPHPWITGNEIILVNREVVEINAGKAFRLY